MLAIIGGSGLTQLAALAAQRREAVATPYGPPSADLTFGTLSGREVVFLARHGERHTIPPHRVNYRANVWALHARNVRDVISVATVGGIREDFGPGTLVVPGQIIDYTHGRESTFHEGGEEGARHIDFTHPYCEALRRRLLDAAADVGECVADGATYAATQGPRLETAAEIDRLERDGAHIVGMTAMPEAALAREKDLCYAAIALVVNHAAGRGESAAGIRLSELETVLRTGMERVIRIIDRLAARYGN
ncbi:MAG: S-methyl-5'-thioinosine phosphorylase [Betaproteobacteria bacterium]